MTDSLLRRSQHVLTPVHRRDLEAALALCQVDPVAYVIPAAQLESALRTGTMRPGLWALRRRKGLGSDLYGVVWSGANLTAVLPDDASDMRDNALADLAGALVSRTSKPASLVGEREVTLDLWHRVEPWWGPSRQLRTRQWSMAVHGPPHRIAVGGSWEDLEPVRLARMEDFDALLPACVHMFRAEVGYDPMLHGRAAYEDRLRSLMSLGRSYLRFGRVDGRRQVVFKAEIGALSAQVAQLHGVWVHPDLRGRGLAKASMGDVVADIQERTAPWVSLYVNDFNHAAVQSYRAVGFETVGEFATVML